MSHGRLHRVCVSEDSSSPNRASSWWKGCSGKLFRGDPSVTRKQTWAHFPPLAFGPVGRAIADQLHRTARSPLGLFEMKDTKAEEKTREAPNAVRQHRPGGQAGAWQETSDKSHGWSLGRTRLASPKEEAFWNDIVDALGFDEIQRFQRRSCRARPRHLLRFLVCRSEDEIEDISRRESDASFANSRSLRRASGVPSARAS